jgi:hypothetical protein
MATGEPEKRVLIARDASDLAFRIGQAVWLKVIRVAVQNAATQNVDLVTADCVEAAVAKLNLAEIVKATGGRIQHDEPRSRGGEAA